MSLEIINQMILDAGMGYLATSEGDQPRVRAMMPVLLEDGLMLAATFPQTNKLSQIAKNPKFEICFVDRKLSHCRIQGRAAVSDRAQLKQQLWDKQMMLRQFFSGPEDPNFVLLVLTPEKVMMMNIGDKAYAEVKF